MTLAKKSEYWLAFLRGEDETGILTRLLDEEFRAKMGGAAKHLAKWRAFYRNDSLDRKLNQMLDKIQDIVGDASLTQLFVHDSRCPSCKESLPKFVMISSALSDRLDNYEGTAIELKENVSADNLEASGLDIYQFFNGRGEVNGVPFVIQNAKVLAEGDGSRRFELVDKFFVAYVGKLDPFRFLADVFGIDNERMVT